MMVSLQADGTELQWMIDGGDQTQALMLIEAAAVGIRAEMTKAGVQLPPPIYAQQTGPQMWLPNGHGRLPQIPPPGHLK